MFSQANPKDHPDIVWCGRSRKCPACSADFVSQFNRGQCPQCRFVFLAMEVYGLPEDFDQQVFQEELIREAARLKEGSEWRKDWVMDLLIERATELPERPEHFNNPKLKDLLVSEIAGWERRVRDARRPGRWRRIMEMVNFGRKLGSDVRKLWFSSGQERSKFGL